MKSLTGLLLCTCLWLFAGGGAVAMAQDSAEDELLLKAAFIYNFAKFTLWPEDAMGEAGTPFSLCIAGEDDLADALARLSGNQVKGRPLSILAVREARLPGRCQMLYVAASQQRGYPDLLRSLHGRPILTVSELPRFASSGGVIELYREHERVRFIINLGIARGAGLEISPSLLRLAAEVYQGQDP
ncbi:MAG: YfiR family protein [Gallionellaceae bacterium]|nr:YfiR family protein [Gallionellaceae bacterium]